MGETKISHETLREKLFEFAGEEDFEAHLYYESLTAPSRLHFERQIEGLGKVELFLVAGSDDYPKRVALTRKTGMVIDWKRFSSRKPFSGYLVCGDDSGNQLLRSLEPPRHDTWDLDRGGPNEKRVLREMYDWVRICVRELNPITDTATLDVPDLARFLPDDAEDNEQEAPINAAANQPDNGFKPTPSKQPIPIHVQPIPPVVPSTSNEGGANENDDPAIVPHGNGKRGGKQKGGQAGDLSVEESKERVPHLSLRSFLERNNRYQLFIRTDLDYVGDVRLVAVGEDGQEEHPTIHEAVATADNSSLKTNNATIRALVLSTKRPTKITVTLVNRAKLALNAVPA